MIISSLRSHGGKASKGKTEDVNQEWGASRLSLTSLELRGALMERLLICRSQKKRRLQVLGGGDACLPWEWRVAQHLPEIREAAQLRAGSAFSGGLW